MVTRDNLLTTKKRGDHLFHDEVNAIARALRPNVGGRLGHDEEGMTYLRDPSHKGAKPQQVYYSENVPAYSVFTLNGAAEFTDHPDPVKIVSAKWGINNPGSPLIWYTNNNLQGFQCSYGWAYPIGLYEEFWVKYSGPAPERGLWCGPSLDGYTVRADRFGFVVLDLEKSSSRVKVMRSNDPQHIIGKVTQTITRYNPATKRLGIGKVRIYYRRNNDKVAEGADPGAGTFTADDCSGSADEFQTSEAATIIPFDVYVFNYCCTEFAVGDRVKADNTLGVGLVVDGLCDVGSEECPSSSSSGPSSSSSGPSSGSGGSSEESGGSESASESASGSAPQSEGSEASDGSSSASAGPCEPITVSGRPTLTRLDNNPCGDGSSGSGSGSGGEEVWQLSIPILSITYNAERQCIEQEELETFNAYLCCCQPPQPSSSSSSDSSDGSSEGSDVGSGSSSGSQTCFEDTFTDTDATNLADHTPDEGIEWLSLTGAADWQVEGNRALQKATDVGVVDTNDPPVGEILYRASIGAACSAPGIQCAADIEFNESIIIYAFRGGLLCRVVDNNNWFAGVITVDNSGGLFTQIIEKTGGTLFVRSSTSRGMASTHGFSGSQGGPFAVKIKNESGQVSFETPMGTETYSSTTNQTVKDMGVFAEVCNILADPDEGVADHVSVDNFIASEI